MKVTRLQGGPQTKLWTCWQNFELSRSFERIVGRVHVFAVLQPRISWSDQKVCKTECVVLETSFQGRPVWAHWTHSCNIQILKVTPLKVSYLSQNFENLEQFFMGEPWPWTWFPQRVFGGKLSFRKMSARGCLCTFQENPHFWVPMLKVRRPVGILLCRTSRMAAALLWRDESFGTNVNFLAENSNHS